MAESPDMLLRRNFERAVSRQLNNVPLVKPEFVAEQGPSVHIVDVRTSEELSGPIGHIPYVTWVPLAEVARIPQVWGRRAIVVIVSRTQDRAMRVALYLEALGMRYVAAMAGGMAAWRGMGFAISRDDNLHRLEPRPPQAPDPDPDDIDVAFIERHIAEPRHVRWVKLAGFLLHGKRACVDGRDQTGVIGTPGGDTGEMIIVLAAVERLTRTTFDRARIAPLIEAHTDAFGSFYLHTDAHSMVHLQATLLADPRLADVLDGVDTPHEWRVFLDAPPTAVRPIVLDALLDTAHVGCGHVRLSMQNAAEYGVRGELVREFLATYFTMRWEGAPELEYVVLGGEHNERAVLDIHLETDEFQPFTKIPLVSPSAGGVQFFVNHPQVAAYLREQTVRLMSGLPELGLDHARIPDALAEVEFLAAQQIAATLSHLASGLPIFRVEFDNHRGCRVSRVGNA